MKLNSVLQGNTLEILKTFPNESIDTVITSPPYYQTRYYPQAECVWGGKPDCDHQWEDWNGWQKCKLCGALWGELGLEPTPELYIDHLVEIFLEVKRVLKKTGTFWLNIGDRYNTSGTLSYRIWTDRRPKEDKRPKMPEIKAKSSYPPKSLLLLPFRVAERLIENGFILRNVIVWSKTNPLPQPIQDRFKSAWEPILFFTKDARYYFNREDIAIPYAPTTLKRIRHANYSDKTRYAGFTNEHWDKLAQRTYQSIPFQPLFEQNNAEEKSPTTMPTDVWTISYQPFRDYHFATFPEKLVELCILAGCPEDGIVLDPFAGSGTTLVVAKKLGRKYIGIEMVEEYIRIINKRLERIGEFLL